MKVPYNSNQEKESIIHDYTSQGYTLISDNGTLEGNYLEFREPQPSTEIELLQKKLAAQEQVIEELMFIIIPELSGGGI